MGMPRVHGEKRIDAPGKTKSAPDSSVPGRFGSPPPELPNYAWILKFRSSSVNVTYVIRAIPRVTLRQVPRVTTTGSHDR